MENPTEYNLEKWESELLDEIENEDWVSVPNLQEEISAIKQAAINTNSSENQEVKLIFLSKADIEALRQLSKKNYKSIDFLISEIVHNYLEKQNKHYAY